MIIMKDNLKIIESLRILTQKIFNSTSRGFHRPEFLCEVSKMILDFSGCDAVALWLKEGDRIYRCETLKGVNHFPKLDAISFPEPSRGKTSGHLQTSARLWRLCMNIINRKIDRTQPCFTGNGSFWTGDAFKNPLLANARTKKRAAKLGASEEDRSIAVIPLTIGQENIGLLKLKSKQRNYFAKPEIGFYELVAQTLGFALSNQQTQAALQERVKELTCLYGISQLCEQEGVSLDVILQGIVEHLPIAWQYPEIAGGRIVFDGQSYQTSGFRESRHKLSVDIVVYGKKRGSVEIVYSEQKPDLDEAPFLMEERNLIDTVATQIELIIQRKQAEEEKSRLSAQLRHADRLATIGQLAAGVAHELNEPLGSILGFAQITKKSSELPGQTGQDIDKIIKASLHAREIVKKLMLFGRQTPLQKTKVNINKLVEEGLYFIESRAAKEGIELIKVLAPDLPEITADPSQLNQVMVNLVVNAVQAMPKGGKLTVSTSQHKDHICLIVEDTGTGMNEIQMQQIFIPFYTTKEIGQGTGLGLPVVHGIITSHGGSIQVNSKPGRGTRFEIQLPRN